MKSHVAPAFLTVLLIATGISPAEQGKPEVPKAKAMARQITVKLVGLDDKTPPYAEVTVPAIERENAPMQATATLEGEGWLGETVDISAYPDAGIGVMKIKVESVDRPALAKGSTGSLDVSSSHTRFQVAIIYSGPGDYEVYRNHDQRMVVTVK